MLFNSSSIQEYRYVVYLLSAHRLRREQYATLPSLPGSADQHSTDIDVHHASVDFLFNVINDPQDVSERVDRGHHDDPEFTEEGEDAEGDLETQGE